MDLHSGTSYWILANGLGFVVPPISSDLECDVAIIGGGITGALVCDGMTRAGLRAVVLDRRDLGFGSTVASTALLQYDTDMPLHELSELIGLHSARRVFKAGLHAVDRVLELAAELDCPSSRKHSLYLCTSDSDIDAMRRELDARVASSLECRWLDATELRSGWGIVAKGAILSAAAGQVNPYCLCHALLRRAAQRGAAVHDRTKVTEIHKNGTGWRLLTDRGPEVRAKLVVHATGYESASRLPAGLVKLNSTYAFASEPTRPAPGCWVDRALVWEHADPYLYVRWEGDRLLVGGEDEDFADEQARDALMEKKTAAIAKKCRALMPEVQIEPAFMWTGTFASTRDSLGYIGELPDGAGHEFALGFGGNGITFSMIAAEVLTAAALGRRHPDAELFAFSRPTAGANEP